MLAGPGPGSGVRPAADLGGSRPTLREALDLLVQDRIEQHLRHHVLDSVEVLLGLRDD